MIRTIVSIFVTLALIAGGTVYEMYYVHTTFSDFSEIVKTLYKKTEAHTATAEDGEAVRNFWEEKKRKLHVWIPHTALLEMDLQMDEALGFLHLQDYEDALPKIEVMLGIADTVPSNYTFGIENVF